MTEGGNSRSIEHTVEIGSLFELKLLDMPTARRDSPGVLLHWPVKLLMLLTVSHYSLGEIEGVLC